MRSDDCVEFVAVDGTPIFNQICGVCRNCDPFQLTLPESVSAGTHELSLRIRNLQGLSTFDLRQAHGFGLIESGIVLTVALMWLWVVRRRHVSIWAWWVVIVAMLLSFGYYLSTDFWTRQMDVEGHREYVQFILTQHSLPRVDASWETFQPPLYYTLSAGWIALGMWLSSIESWRWLQALATLAFLATVMIGVSVWPKFGLSKSSWPGLALFIFLPAHLYLSARINNDVLLPLWGTLVTFFLWDYAQHDRLPSLWGASFCAVAAMLTKTSGLSLFVGAVVFIGWHEWSKGRTMLQAIDRLSWVILPALVWILIWGLID